MNTPFAAEKPAPGYRLSARIDLIRNRRQMLQVNGLAIALAVLLILLGLLLQPDGAEGFLNPGKGMDVFWLELLIAVGGSILYIIGHEAVHGLFMWLFSRRKPHFGLSFTYAYAGSRMYFAKVPYMIIALSPVVCWGAAFALLAFVLPAKWFWSIWVLQVFNLSGAAGDLYVSARMLRQPSGVMVQDTGTAMSLWNRR